MEHEGQLLRRRRHELALHLTPAYIIGKRGRARRGDGASRLLVSGPGGRDGAPARPGGVVPALGGFGFDERRIFATLVQLFLRRLHVIELAHHLEAAFKLAHIIDHPGPAERRGGASRLIVDGSGGRDRAPARPVGVVPVLGGFGVDQRTVVAALRQLLQPVRKIELGDEVVEGTAREPDRQESVDDARLELAPANFELAEVGGEIPALFPRRLLASRIDRTIEGDRRGAVVLRAVFIRARDAYPGVEGEVLEAERFGLPRRFGLRRDRALVIVAHPQDRPELH